MIDGWLLWMIIAALLVFVVFPWIWVLIRRWMIARERRELSATDLLFSSLPDDPSYDWDALWNELRAVGLNSQEDIEQTVDQSTSDLTPWQIRQLLRECGILPDA